MAKPIERGIADQDEYVGRFVAVDSVEIRARVSGYLDQIHFRDGSADILPEAKEILDAIATTLVHHPDFDRVEIPLPFRRVTALSHRYIPVVAQACVFG